METDFLIVGGGIGGLVLAELLGRGGKRVVVLERSTASPSWSRPEVLWPATFELLCQLLPKTEWEQEAVVPLRGVEFFDGQQFRAAIDSETLDSIGVQPWSTDPNRTRELLMGLRSFELHRGMEVKAVLREQGKIVGVQARDTTTGAERQFLGEWTVGDDGAKSLVRAACGIDLTTRMLPIEFLCFQCDRPESFPGNRVRAWPNFRQPRSGIFALGMAPVAKQRSVGLVGVRSTIFDDLSRAQAAWKEFVTTEPILAEVHGWRRFPDDFQRVRRPWGHARRYGGPGALLMGDAAHPVSPAGGQGANMSVADGRAIAELALAGTRDLVTAYERRRRPPNRRSVRITRLLDFVLILPDWLLPPIPLFWVFRQVGRYPSLVPRVLRTFSTTFLER